MSCECESSPNFPHEHIKGKSSYELINNYIKYIHEHTERWNCKGIHVPWFRGQPNIKSPLPKVLRGKRNCIDGRYDEFWLSTTFRNRAPSFGETPENRNDIDKWLFLMRHVELPTRLLDWTESALAALFFAVSESRKDENEDAAVWVIDPVALNHLSLNINEDLDKQKLLSDYDCFPNTWVEKRQSLENIRLAFMHPSERFAGHNPSEEPIAIQLTYCHPRMSAQKGCFTVHGTDGRGFEEIFNKGSNLFKKKYFRKYIINKNDISRIRESLQTLGVTNSTIFPDLFGLAKELEERFWYSYQDQQDQVDSTLKKKTNLIMKTKLISNESVEALHNEYHKVVAQLIRCPDFYCFERTDFAIEDKMYKYYIGYLAKE